MVHQGHCLCNKTQVVVNDTQDKQIACHCLDCQHTSGAAHSTNILAKIADVKITGDAHAYESSSASGNTVTRIFCGTCGSPIGHKSKAFGDAMAVQTGNLPDFQKIPFGAELFTKDRWSGIPQIPGADQAKTMPDA